MRKYLYIYRERGKILLVGAYRNKDLTVKELEIGWRHKYYLPNVHTRMHKLKGVQPPPPLYVITPVGYIHKLHAKVCS